MHMVTESFTQPNANDASYAQILRELGNSAKDLIHNEIGLIKTEFSHTARRVSKHSAQAALFGGLVALSVLPFLAFAVIGLGELLDGRYWLSSLIVAVVCAGVGGVMAYRAFQKIKEEDLEFSRTRERLEQNIETVQEKVQEVKDAAKGRNYEIDQLH